MLFRSVSQSRYLDFDIYQAVSSIFSRDFDSVYFSRFALEYLADSLCICGVPVSVLCDLHVDLISHIVKEILLNCYEYSPDVNILAMFSSISIKCNASYIDMSYVVED